MKKCRSGPRFIVLAVAFGGITLVSGCDGPPPTTTTTNTTNTQTSH